jgi:hypothetical protein
MPISGDRGLNSSVIIQLHLTGYNPARLRHLLTFGLSLATFFQLGQTIGHSLADLPGLTFPFFQHPPRHPTNDVFLKLSSTFFDPSPFTVRIKFT